MQKDYPLISIQILNWNRAEETLRAIQSAKNQSYPNIEIVLVDNGSEDRSIELIERFHPDVKLVKLDRNYGCPGGRNRGIPYCRGEYIFYLDNDGVLHKDAVYNAFVSISTKDKVGIVTGTIYDFEKEEEISIDCQYKSNRRYFYNEFQGGISLHDVKIYEKVGYYPDHFIYGQEETYLSLKLHDTDYGIIKDETVVLWHKKSIVARNSEKEMLNSFFNKLYIAISLFPIVISFFYQFYFAIKYPYYSLRAGVFLGFVNKVYYNLIPTYKLAIKNRKPVSYRAYQKHKSICLMQ